MKIYYEGKLVILTYVLSCFTKLNKYRDKIKPNINQSCS